jgi:Na+/H+ antiporter NhaA
LFLVALELKRELVLGELGNPRMAALSIAAALGGMLVPATLYLTLQSGHTGEGGWATVMATDTAFVIGCLALLGSRIPQSLPWVCDPYRLATARSLIKLDLLVERFDGGDGTFIFVHL